MWLNEGRVGMFGDGWTEILIIVIVAVVVIGPKDLPRVLRNVGRWVTSIRRTAAQFQGQFSEAMREAGHEVDLAEARKTFEELKSLNPLKNPLGGLTSELLKVESAGQSLRNELSNTIRPPSIDPVQAAPLDLSAHLKPKAEVKRPPLKSARQARSIRWQMNRTQSRRVSRATTRTLKRDMDA